MASTEMVDVPEGSGWVVPRRLYLRLVYLIAVIGPLLGFVLSLDTWAYNSWQDGSPRTYLDMSFDASVWVWFLPFVLYASFSMLALLWDSDRFSRVWPVRLGIYTGVVVNVQFTIQALIAREYSGLLLFGGVSIPPLIALYALLGWLFRLRSQPEEDLPFPKSVVILGIGATILAASLSLPFQLPAGVALAPILSCLTAYRLLTQAKGQPTSRRWSKVTSGAGLVTAYGVSSKMAIDQVFELYAQLPTSPPDCYVATASSNGHPNFVNASPVQLDNGQTVWVTKQLQTLKAGELVLRELAPVEHRRVRRVYDFVGPKIAGRIQSRWSADVSYLLLKPFEQVALVFLKRRFPEQFEKVNHLYMGR